MAQYEIIIKRDSSAGGRSKSPFSISKINARAKEISHQYGLDQPTSSQAAEKIITYGMVKPFVKQILQHQVNTVELRTGAAELQEKISFAYQIGGQAISIIESVAIGAMIGNLPGALLGAGLSIGGTMLGYAQAADTIRLQGQLESIGNSMLNVRAGGQVQTYGGSRERRQ